MNRCDRENVVKKSLMRDGVAAVVLVGVLATFANGAEESVPVIEAVSGLTELSVKVERKGDVYTGVSHGRKPIKLLGEAIKKITTGGNTYIVKGKLSADGKSLEVVELKLVEKVEAKTK